MTFRFSTIRLAVRPAYQSYKDDCQCDGATLWKHPSGCKCGFAQRERERKAREKGKEFLDDFDFEFIGGGRS